MVYYPLQLELQSPIVVQERNYHKNVFCPECRSNWIRSEGRQGRKLRYQCLDGDHHFITYQNQLPLFSGRPPRLGFLASNGGTNMQEIINACNSGDINAEPCVVISNNSSSRALRRAAEAGITHYYVSTVTHPDDNSRDTAIRDLLKRHEVDIVVLSGYMKLLGPETISGFRNRIVNIHPSLLPNFGGRGFYGKAVHKAVLEAKVPTTGATTHFVDEEYDHGSIIDRIKVPVREDDTVERLADRVLMAEHQLYLRTLVRASEAHLAGRPIYSIVEEPQPHGSQS